MRGSLPIIDTHQHLWDLDKFRLEWLAGEPKLNRCYRLADYLAEAEGLGIVKAVSMEVDVTPDQQTAEATWALDLCDHEKAVPAGAVISGRPASDGFKAYLDRFRDRKALKGVRQVLHVPGTPAGYCLAPGFVAGMRLLGERGLSFDLCIRPGELPNVAKLADECPDTSFILDHCGNPGVRTKDLAPWKAEILRLAERKNVVAKISGIVASAAPGPWTADDLAPIVNHVLDAFGPDRVVFGGDWPVCTLAATLRQWVEALKTIVAARPEADRRRLFHDNAVRVYRL